MKKPFNKKKSEPPKGTSDGDSDSFIYGRNSVLGYLENEATLESGNSRVNKIFLFNNAGSDSRLTKIQSLAKSLKIQVKSVPKEKIESLLNRENNPNHQGVVAALSPVELKTMQDLVGMVQAKKDSNQFDDLTIVLADGVEDPRNLGAIIRSSEALGAFSVVIPERRATGVTDIVAKTSAGALAHLPIVKVTNLVKSLEKLKELGFWVVGLAPEAEQPIYRINLSGPIVLVVGSEGKGMGRLVSKNCDFLASIPSLGKTDSLNVSVALGIGLFEIVRQRNLKSENH